MPVERRRLEALFGRTADLIVRDGSALVVLVGPVAEDRAGIVTVEVTVLAVERRGTEWRFGPGDHASVALADLKDVRAVLFLSESGM
jgi:hypothetical protein